jgi:hypothetical protein
MTPGVPALAAAVLMVAGSAAAQDGHYTTKADARAGRLTAGRAVARPGTVVPDAGGETCGTATPIVALPFNDADDTTGHVNDNDDIPKGCSDYTQTSGPDLIYVFTTGAGNNIAFTVSPTDNVYDPALYVLGTCGNSATCVVGADACLAEGQPQPQGCADGNGDEDIPASLDRFTPGTHALYVDSFYAPDTPCGGQGNILCGQGPYTLAITGVLPAELIDIFIE